MSNNIVVKLVKTSLNIIGFFSPLLEYRGRRILFLSSFSSTCVNEGILDRQTLQVIKKELGLDNNQSMNLGMSLYEQITPKKQVASILKPARQAANTENRQYVTLTEAEKAGANISAKVPEWLRYSELQTDVVDLLCENPIRRT